MIGTIERTLNHKTVLCAKKKGLKNYKKWFLVREGGPYW